MPDPAACLPMLGDRQGNDGRCDPGKMPACGHPSDGVNRAGCGDTGMGDRSVMHVMILCGCHAFIQETVCKQFTG